MRLTGATLLVIGFLLCVSIAWAAIGFFAMGFGLIFLLIAEERKKMSALHLESAAIQPDPIVPSQPTAAPVPSARRARFGKMKPLGAKNGDRSLRAIKSFRR